MRPRVERTSIPVPACSRVRPTATVTRTWLPSIRWDVGLQSGPGRRRHQGCERIHAGAARSTLSGQADATCRPAARTHLPDG